MEKYRLSPSYLRRRNSYRKDDHEDDFGYSRWKRWSAQTFTSQRQSNLSFILSVSSERRITHRANEQWINEARFSSHAFKSNHMSLICITCSSTMQGRWTLDARSWATVSYQRPMLESFEIRGSLAFHPDAPCGNCGMGGAQNHLRLRHSGRD